MRIPFFIMLVVASLVMIDVSNGSTFVGCGTGLLSNTTCSGCEEQPDSNCKCVNVYGTKTCRTTQKFCTSHPNGYIFAPSGFRIYKDYTYCEYTEICNNSLSQYECYQDSDCVVLPGIVTSGNRVIYVLVALGCLNGAPA